MSKSVCVYVRVRIHLLQSIPKADSNQTKDAKQVFKDGVLDLHDRGNDIGTTVLITCEQEKQYEW